MQTQSVYFNQGGSILNTLEAHEKALLDVFCDKYSFRVPSYQRPYAWTREQVSELLSDLSAAAETKKATELQHAAPYFLGSVVLIKDQNTPEADIVDGQQRLTSLTILLCVLRDLATGDDPALIHKHICEKGDRFQGTQDRFRLRTRERDAQFFRKTIQELGATKVLPLASVMSDSQSRIVENARYLQEQLSAYSSDDRDRLVSYITRKCFLVLVEASDHESAFRIFSVLNSRGLDLSPTDILKAEIIGAIPEHDQDQYTKIWEDLEDQLGRAKFADLFAHIRMIARKQKMRGTLVSEFREFVKAVNRPADFIAEDLSSYADAYSDVLHLSFESRVFAEEINQTLKHLSRLDNSDWEAPAILVMARRKAEPRFIKDFLVQLERLAYALFLLRRDPTERISRYGKLLTAIETASNLDDELSPLQLSPNEKLYVRQALNGNVYLTTAVRQPLLLRLDEALSSGGATYDHTTITVEHVLPQNPTPGSKWLVDFPDEDIRNSWVHRLANLVLLTRRKNSAAGNYDFARKKVEYFRPTSGVSPFALTTTVLTKDLWNIQTLEEIQKHHVATLSALWQLD